MTLEDKLRFLADRVEDCKPFLIENVEYVFSENILRIGGATSGIEVNEIEFVDLKLKPTWEFTKDEKVILRNISDKWKWIVRDKSGKLCLYDQEPYKEGNIWGFSTRDFTLFNCFNHLFQSVQWEDDEACEFREYI